MENINYLPHEMKYTSYTSRKKKLFYMLYYMNICVSIVSSKPRTTDSFVVNLFLLIAKNIFYVRKTLMNILFI